MRLDSKLSDGVGSRVRCRDGVLSRVSKLGFELKLDARSGAEFGC